MGQGFVLANLTKRECVSPHDMGLGYKVGEFGSFGDNDFDGSLVHFARVLTAKDGRWHGDRVMFVGDYGDIYEFVGKPEATDDDYKEIYENYAMLTDEARQFALNYADWSRLERLRRDWKMLDAIRSHDFGDGTDIDI